MLASFGSKTIEYCRKNPHKTLLATIAVVGAGAWLLQRKSVQKMKNKNSNHIKDTQLRNEKIKVEKLEKPKTNLIKKSAASLIFASQMLVPQ